MEVGLGVTTYWVCGGGDGGNDVLGLWRWGWGERSIGRGEGRMGGKKSGERGGGDGGEKKEGMGRGVASKKYKER